MEANDIRCSVCSTRKHDYVIFGARCVAVRDRETGAWLEDHHAEGERIALMPTRIQPTRLASWKLVIHTFGVQIEAGTVLAITKPDAEMRMRLLEVLPPGSLMHARAAHESLADAG